MGGVGGASRTVCRDRILSDIICCCGGVVGGESLVEVRCVDVERIVLAESEHVGRIDQMRGVEACTQPAYGCGRGACGDILRQGVARTRTRYAGLGADVAACVVALQGVYRRESLAQTHGKERTVPQCGREASGSRSRARPLVARALVHAYVEGRLVRELDVAQDLLWLVVLHDVDTLDILRRDVLRGQRIAVAQHVHAVDVELVYRLALILHAARLLDLDARHLLEYVGEGLVIGVGEGTGVVGERVALHRYARCLHHDFAYGRCGGLHDGIRGSGPVRRGDGACGVSQHREYKGVTLFGLSGAQYGVCALVVGGVVGGNLARGIGQLDYYARNGLSRSGIGDRARDAEGVLGTEGCRGENKGRGG